MNCNDLSFNLQSCVAENEEGPTTNVRQATIGPSITEISPSGQLKWDDIVVRAAGWTPLIIGASEQLLLA